jgi:hypothetical protein
MQIADHGGVFFVCVPATHQGFLEGVDMWRIDCLLPQKHYQLSPQWVFSALLVRRSTDQLVKADQSRSTLVKAVAGQSRSAKPVEAGQNRSAKPVKIRRSKAQNRSNPVKGSNKRVKPVKPVKVDKLVFPAERESPKESLFYHMLSFL